MPLNGREVNIHTIRSKGSNLSHTRALIIYSLQRKFNGVQPLRTRTFLEIVRWIQPHFSEFTLDGIQTDVLNIY